MKQLHFLPQESEVVFFHPEYWDVYVSICKPTNSKTGRKR